MSQWTYDPVLHLPEPTAAEVLVGREVPKRIVLENIGRTCMKVLRASQCMIAYDERKERHFIALGLSDEEATGISHLPKGIGLLGELWREGQETIRLDRIASHAKSSGCPHGHPPFDAFLGTPIRYDGKTLGVIYLSKPPGEPPFSADDENTVEVLASACAVELANAETFDKLKCAYEDLESRTHELDHANRQLREHEQELDRVNKQLKIHTIDLELMNEELTAANRAKDQFLANTSHELRTPLNAIIGFSELLADKRMGEMSDKQQRYVEHITTSGKRLLEIINALLDISKIDSGMMEIHETPFDPAEMGAQLVAEMMPLARKKQIDLLLEAPQQGRHCIRSDRDKIYQVLVNLIGNALKFTPEQGRVIVSLIVTEGDCEDQHLYCRVEDNGIGIAEVDQQKVFKPFEQASTGVARSHGGTGLGLSLSKHIVELLGGTIGLESQLGRGSVFSINLPVTAMDRAAAEADGKPWPCQEQQQLPQPKQQAEDQVEEVLPPAPPQATVMIVDEDSARAEAAREMFSHEGYQVVVTSLDRVGEAIASCHPLLIVLGVTESGAEFYPRLQQLKRVDATNKTPTILLSGDAEHLHFCTGGAIGQIDSDLERHDLLDMVSHLGLQAPTLPTAPLVLVVDDDDSVREYLKETLTVEGYRVLLAANGEEGIAAAIARDPDLIILDLMMPGISGFEVIRRLKGHPSACDIPVIIFTAKSLSQSEALLLGQDVERIMVKGVSNRRDVLQQLHKLELLYPVRAKLMDAKLDCFNLRYMQRRLEHEVSRAARYHHRFALLACRMDGFDQYCKQHGNRWGLAALKSSVSILNVIIRKADVVARFDNDCLLVLLPGLSQQGCYSVGEKIRLRISHQFLPLPGEQKGRMTVSIGGVSSDEAQDSATLMKLLKRRMAMAAEEGGNRIVMEE